jgi:VanZ family protein
VERKYKVLGITAVLVLYIALLFVGAVIKVPAEISSITNGDKIIHFMEYFILALVLFKSLQLYKLKKINIYVLGIIIGIVFMLLSETVQLFVPGRSFSFYDMLADFMGFIIGMGVFKWIFFRL